jgi:hypothetical protein
MRERLLVVMKKKKRSDVVCVNRRKSMNVNVNENAVADMVVTRVVKNKLR